MPVANLLRDVYSYRWRAPGWVAGPIFLAGGVALLFAAIVKMDGHPLVIGLGVLFAAVGAVVTTTLEGFDYTPKERKLAKWSSRMGRRKGEEGFDLKEGGWLRLDRQGAKHVVLLCAADEQPSPLVETTSPEYASKVAKSLARILKMELRDS